MDIHAYTFVYIYYTFTYLYACALTERLSAYDIVNQYSWCRYSALKYAKASKRKSITMNNKFTAFHKKIKNKLSFTFLHI